MAYELTWLNAAEAAAAACKFFVTNSNGVTGNNVGFGAGVRYPPAANNDSVTGREEKGSWYERKCNHNI